MEKVDVVLEVNQLIRLWVCGVCVCVCVCVGGGGSLF